MDNIGSNINMILVVVVFHFSKLEIPICCNKTIDAPKPTKFENYSSNTSKQSIGCHSPLFSMGTSIPWPFFVVIAKGCSIFSYPHRVAWFDNDGVETLYIVPNSIISHWLDS